MCWGVALKRINIHRGPGTRQINLWSARVGGGLLYASLSRLHVRSGCWLRLFFLFLLVGLGVQIGLQIIFGHD